MKKRWIYVTVMVGLLTLAITGGVAAANFGGGGSAADDVNNRAAEILGVEPQALDDALGDATFVGGLLGDDMPVAGEITEIASGGFVIEDEDGNRVSVTLAEDGVIRRQ